MKTKHIIIVGISVVLSFLMIGCGESGDEGTAPESVPDNSKPYVLRVLTYNIFHGETTFGQIDMDLFGQIIKDEKPDLVALQEVDKGTTRSGGMDQTELLARYTGLAGYFAKARNFQGGEYGVAILSKLPVDEFIVVPAYKTGTYGTAYAYAKIKLDENTHIWFNSSHLSTNTDERAVHTRELVDYYRTNLRSAPLIIAGDLNAQLSDSEMRILKEEFNESDTNLMNTFSTRTGLRSKIDYIMYPKAGDWKVRSVKRICRPEASDHCAVFAELEYTKR